AHDKGRQELMCASDWSAGNIFVPSGADQSFAEQSGADTSAFVPSLSCAPGAHIRKTHIINKRYATSTNVLQKNFSQKDLACIDRMMEN
ncbi:hypothetical protein Tco_0183033, partial [Tanacetum coccineum]